MIAHTLATTELIAADAAVDRVEPHPPSGHLVPLTQAQLGALSSGCAALSLLIEDLPDQDSSTRDMARADLVELVALVKHLVQRGVPR